MATDKQTPNPTDDQTTRAENSKELSERDLKQLVGGAIDSYMQFLSPAPSEPEEKP